MRFEVSDARGFRDLLKVVNTVIDEPTFKFSDEGLQVLGMDPSHVAMLDLRLPPEYFDRFDCGAVSGDPVRMTVNSSEWVRMIGSNTRLSKDTYLDLSYEDGDKSVEFRLRDTLGTTRVKRIPALEPIDDEVPEPKIFFKSYARVLLKDISKLVLPDMQDVSEHICIQIRDTDDPDEQPDLMFSATGDMGSCSVNYSRDHAYMLELRLEESAKATYTLSYLIDFFKVIKGVSEVIGIHMRTDMPVKLDVEIPQGQLIYYLAPCIGV